MSDGSLVKVTVCDGKYTVSIGFDGEVKARIYGQEWRDLTGDLLVWALVMEVDSLRQELYEAKRIQPPSENLKQTMRVVRSQPRPTLEQVDRQMKASKSHA